METIWLPLTVVGLQACCLRVEGCDLEEVKVQRLALLVPRNYGKKHRGRARRGEAVGPKVTFLSLRAEKGWKVGEIEGEARSRRPLAGSHLGP